MTLKNRKVTIKHKRKVETFQVKSRIEEHEHSLLFLELQKGMHIQLETAWCGHVTKFHQEIVSRRNE